MVICTLSTKCRFEHEVGEPEYEQVEHFFLPEEVIDPEHGSFGEGFQHAAIELASRSEVPAERLLDHDAPALVESGCGESLYHGVEQARRNRQVEQRPVARAERPGQPIVRVGLAVIAA